MLPSYEIDGIVYFTATLAVNARPRRFRTEDDRAANLPRGYPRSVVHHLTVGARHPTKKLLRPEETKCGKHRKSANLRFAHKNAIRGSDTKLPSNFKFASVPFKGTPAASRKRT
jgi:hypothetical protein